MVDGRVARGARTRLAVLDTAVALSSVYGLDAMSLARLADETGISKSGLFTHWPDKEILQLAIVEHAVRQWTDEIVTPALADAARRAAAVGAARGPAGLLHVPRAARRLLLRGEPGRIRRPPRPGP